MMRENPFSSALSRNIVDGAYFIGRDQIIQQIQDAVILPQNQKGSIAVIGLPDIGKRCVIEKATQMHKHTIQDQKAIYVTIDIKNYIDNKEHDAFFRALISKFILELEYANFSTQETSELKRLAKEKLSEWDSGIKYFETLEAFFQKVYQLGFKAIYILDNFDIAQSLFKEHTNRIYWLRNLAGPRCRVAWIALSCKPIREIKKLPLPISDDFANSLHIEMFTDKEVTEYFDLFAKMNVNLENEQKKQIIRLCGKHPYLLSLLGYYLIEDYAHRSEYIDVNSTFSKVEERFNLSYERIIELVLTNDGDTEKLYKLRRILIEQAVGVDQRDVDEMFKYGLIMSSQPQNLEEGKATYLAFSKHFQEYLLNKVFSTLNTTENLINSAIKSSIPIQAKVASTTKSTSIKILPFVHGYALLIGVGADLPITAKDATDLHDLLVDPNCAGYPSTQVKLLKEANASREKILEAFDQLIYQVEKDPDATVLVYFSGHGGKFHLSNHPIEYFLVPYGYDSTKPQETFLSDSEFTNKIEAIKARKLVVLLDCCHAGGLLIPKLLEVRFEKSSVPPNLLNKLQAGSGHIIIASSRDNEYSYLDTSNSIFTACLIEALNGKMTAKDDGLARILDILTYLFDQVPQRTSEKQHPFINKVLNMDDNFPLCYYISNTTSIQEEPILKSTTKKLTSGKRQRLEKKLQEHQTTWNLHNQKIQHLRSALDIEVDVLSKFKYEQQLLQEYEFLQQLESELDKIEQELL